MIFKHFFYDHIMFKVDSQQIIENADLGKLSQFFAARKERIYDLICEGLKEQPVTPYIRHILNHPKGQRRSRRFLDAFEEALRGRVHVLFNDQKRIGYKRAVEGYNLEDVFTYKMVFREIIWHLLSNFNDGNKIGKDLINLNDIRFIELLIDYSNYLLSYSFLKTRDEIINRRTKQLQELHRYAAKVLSIFQKEEILSYANQGIYDIFRLYSKFSVLYGENRLLDIGNQGKLVGLQISPEILERTALEAARSNRAMAIDDNNNRIQFHEEMKKSYFKVICIPIHRRNFHLIGFLFIHSQGIVFKFERFNKNLLFQFSYLTGAVLSNFMMFSELTYKQEELHNLTRKLISIQEEERRKIAADIHDTLTQTLTAIGYKALLCQGLMEKDPSRLDDELNRLVLNINGALKESRQMISNLRPRILDDLGIVTIFKRVLNNFQEDTDIKVNFRAPQEMNMSPELSIAFFRILQESLNNINKHAKASKVDVSLGFIDNNKVCLKVKDDGQGFNISEGNQGIKNSGMGLLTMRERVEDLRGQFTIISSEGEGCQINITAPL
jgi:signal transduction histidine kinase